jgi:uncharacterized protein (DUF302 family)
VSFSSFIVPVGALPLLETDDHFTLVSPLRLFVVVPQLPKGI